MPAADRGEAERRDGHGDARTTANVLRASLEKYFTQLCRARHNAERFVDRRCPRTPLVISVLEGYFLASAMNIKTPLAIAAAVVLIIVAVTIAFYVVVVKVPSDLAYKTAEGMRQFFNFTPQVRINQTIVIEQITPILEVATVSREMFIDHSWQQTWMGSTKTIQIQGVFTAKAGFDLREPFRIDIEKRPLHVVAWVPPPKLLSIDMKEYKVLKDENGWWNSVTLQDREEAVRQIRAEAIEKAKHSGLLEESQASVEERIREIVERNGSNVVFKNENADRRRQ